MQKKISAAILLLCLLFLTFSETNRLEQALCQSPPFCGLPRAEIPEDKKYTGKDFSVTSKQKEPSGLYAKACCLMDAESGRCLFGENENKKLPMASTTKIMTCIIALENGSLNSKVTVSSRAASMPDVQLNMQPGDSFYLKDLLYSLMLESHNDTAVAIAEHIGGSVEGFAKLMNNKAAEIGCKKTHFVTPNGLDADGHYTTAKELCLIASYAIQNKKFLSIISTPSRRFQNVRGNRSYSVSNHDAFLSSYQGAIGIKTGFTGKAGYCFCGAAKRQGKTFITSVLACGWPPHRGYKWIDTRKLMDYGFANFETITVKPQKLPSSLPVAGGQKNSVPIASDSRKAMSFMLSETDTVTIRNSLPDFIEAPVRQGDIIGYEEYVLNGKSIFKNPVTAKETVAKRDFGYYRNILFDLFFF